MGDMPKKWKKTKCFSCRHFWPYPVGGYDLGGDWQWECEYEYDELVDADDDCDDFKIHEDLE